MPDDLQNEVYRLRAIIENQNKALAHWRREADRDCGTILRYQAALRKIADLPTTTVEAHTAANVAIEIAKKAL